ncbi:MAG: hypothetical protein OFPII_02860 [Osedax symbiont Rs1]|nr:MAG: hypothetical protein OFPII_02860 [Osedax symbiont Rs1]
MLIYTSNTDKEWHTNSTISPIFAWSYLHSQRYAEVSNKLFFNSQLFPLTCD